MNQLCCVYERENNMSSRGALYRINSCLMKFKSSFFNCYTVFFSDQGIEFLMKGRLKFQFYIYHYEPDSYCALSIDTIKK